MPHVYCLREPALILLHAISDGLIALSYLVIPIALIVLVRQRRDFAFRGTAILFGLFILSCGLTHILGIVTLWHPVYRLDGVVKAFTAFASMGTAVLLIRLVPVAVALPSPEQLRHEIKERRRAEERVNELNVELQHRVAERTSQLEVASDQLDEFAAALDRAPTIIQKLDGTILFWNSGSESMYGWSRGEALGRKSQELMGSELPQPLGEIQEQLLQHGSWVGEFRQHCRNGDDIWVSSFWTLHRNVRGDPVSVVKVNNDITALRRTSEALRATEATVRSLFEHASQGILTVDREGRIVDVNAMVQRLFRYDIDELIGASLETLLPESLRDGHVRHRADYSRQPHFRPMGQGMDLVARRKDGSEFPVEISLSFDAEHQGGLAMAFIADISARKQANLEREAMIERLERALAEKTVLIKEVHHRVKNNLAVVASLLEMQAPALIDERAKASLRESQRRIMSMALIHEYLYATEHLDRVNFGLYVQQLANGLCISSEGQVDRVTVQIEASEIELGVDTAIPCGLILNELLSNSMKHAFPDRHSGKIVVRFAELESGQLLLVCHDDGIGIPEGFEWQNSSTLGLKIVQILTKQIHGKLRLDRSRQGTWFELSFARRGRKPDTDSRGTAASRTIHANSADIRA